MRFKIDENLPVEIADTLAAAAHDALTVVQQGLGGRPDSKIIDICKDECRALVTLDLDFADIRTYPPQTLPGVIVLRLENQSKSHVVEVFSRVVGMLEKEPLAGCLWIADESSVRIRGDSSSP